uniref:Uncharacterized protein n=1 Tax=Arundo donax TaxID=35708 RepID=A0A0A9AA04_ARUDO
MLIERRDYHGQDVDQYEMIKNRGGNEHVDAYTSHGKV